VQMPTWPCCLAAMTRLRRSSQGWSVSRRCGPARYRLQSSPRLWPNPRSTGGICSDLDFGRQIALLLTCWILGYSGLVYGVGRFMTLYFARAGFSARTIFTAGLVASVIVAPVILLASGRLNERFERRYLILAASVMASVGLLLVVTATLAWHSL